MGYRAGRISMALRGRLCRALGLRRRGAAGVLQFRPRGSEPQRLFVVFERFAPLTPGSAGVAQRLRRVCCRGSWAALLGWRR